MAKDFSFMFYPGDVLRHVQFLNKAQKGCYLDVLSSHIENMRFSYDFLIKITKELNEDDRREFVSIFEQDDKGYFLHWVTDSIQKRAAYLLSRSDNKKGKTKKKKPNPPKSYQIDMENENKKEYKEVLEDEKKPKIEIIVPFDSENFKTAWGAWKQYKKEQHKFTYKGEHSEQMALKQVGELSKNNEDTALKILQQSIANGWSGLFELKNNSNGNTKNGRDQRREPADHNADFGKL